MTMMIHVGSKSSANVIVPVEARGTDQTEARRNAITFARARHGISDPIALNEHEAAVRIRQQLLAQHAPKTPVTINGNDMPFWQQREDIRYRQN